MPFKTIACTLVLFVTTLALGSEGLTQTKESLAAETAKLGKMLKGKTIHCTNKKGEETLSLKVTTKNGQPVAQAASPSYGDGGVEATEVAQLQAGELITVYVTGPDGDEGGAVVIMNSAYLDRDGETNANAQIYAGVPGDDFYDESESLRCVLK